MDWNLWQKEVFWHSLELKNCINKQQFNHLIKTLFNEINILISIYFEDYLVVSQKSTNVKQGYDDYEFIATIL